MQIPALVPEVWRWSDVASDKPVNDPQALPPLRRTSLGTSSQMHRLPDTSATLAAEAAIQMPYHSRRHSVFGMVEQLQANAARVTAEQGKIDPSCRFLAISSN